MRRPLAAALLAVLLPHVAHAAPAVIRVFEAPARAEPSKDAAVLELLPEKAEVSVSEEAKDGWRRVRLGDGRVGWIEESAIALGGAGVKAPGAAVPAAGAVVPPVVAPSGAAAAPGVALAAPAAPAPAAPAPDLRAHIYVKDLGHLAELVKEDPKVAPMASRLASRRRAAIAVGVVGGLVSSAFMVAGASKFGDDGDPLPAPGTPEFGQDPGTPPGMKLFAGGVLGALATGIVTIAIFPRGGDVLDVINSWNTAHPDRPFELEHGRANR